MAKEKEKDPAFLFYSKDWLQGTAGLMPDEKGVYIDLLAHQHQDGGLPNDVKRLARMVGLSQSEFDAIWMNLKSKFINHSDNRLVNHKLSKITTERSTKAHTKAILSHFAVLVRSIKTYPISIIDNIKSEFKVIDFEPFEINEATERLSKWFSERLTRALGNGNATVNGNEFKEGAVLGEVIFDIEKYLLEHQKDFEISLMIKPGMTPAKGKEILKKYHLWVTSKEGYPKPPLALIAGFQTWILNEKNYTNGTAHRGTNSNSAPTPTNVSEKGTRTF